MARIPVSRRRARRSIHTVRACLAAALLILFAMICGAVLMSATADRAAQVLTMVAPFVGLVLGFYFGRRG